MPATAVLRQPSRTLVICEGNTAVVDVWCSAVFGLTGEGVEEIPPTTSWLAMALTLRWHQDDGWKLVDLQQSEGPEPVR